MIDDHDRSEWVNVSSGSGSPGLPRQNQESRKMVVCVSVCSGPNILHNISELYMHA